jgi:hypothetical protein
MVGYGEITERARGQESWLREKHPEVFSEQKHLDEGSEQRAYWHYGYMVALRDVLRMQDEQCDLKVN